MNFNLRNILDSDDAYAILDSSEGAGGTWMSGGCAILAFALNYVFDYDIYVIVDEYKKVQHFLNKSHDNKFIDYRGQFSNLKFINGWKKYERLYGEYKLVRWNNYKKYTGGIPIDLDASKKLSRMIQDNIDKSTISLVVENTKHRIKKLIRESNESTYYISTGDLSGFYTLRTKFPETIYRKDQLGRVSDSYVVIRDYFICNLSTDREKAISKAFEKLENIWISISILKTSKEEMRSQSIGQYFKPGNIKVFQLWRFLIKISNI